jgi:hypothetical protein
MANTVKLYFILLILSLTVQADDLQRLFTTPQQRLALEQQRLAPPPEPIITEQNPELPKPPAYIAYNGLMRTKQGKLAIWLNGSQEFNLVQTGYNIELSHNKNNIIITLIQPAYTKIELRPGEILDTENLRILQAYELEAKKILDKFMTSSDS